MFPICLLFFWLLKTKRNRQKLVFGKDIKLKNQCETVDRKVINTHTTFTHKRKIKKLKGSLHYKTYNIIFYPSFRI